VADEQSPLAALRVRLNLSQEDVAEHLGWKYGGAVSVLERGLSFPRPEVVEALAALYGRTQEEIRSAYAEGVPEEHPAGKLVPPTPPLGKSTVTVRRPRPRQPAPSIPALPTRLQHRSASGADLQPFRSTAPPGATAGQILKHIRLDYSLSVQKLAAVLDIAPTKVRRYESDDAELPIRLRLRLFILFGVPPRSLQRSPKAKPSFRSASVAREPARQDYARRIRDVIAPNDDL
jgi:transcriptional regulator with XRE-family HTH domain